MTINYLNYLPLTVLTSGLQLLISLGSYDCLNSTLKHSGNATKLSSATAPAAAGPAVPSSYYVQYVVYPILLACVSVGNVINLIVLGYEKPKGPTNIFLTAVAVSDLFVIWLWFPLFLRNVRPLYKPAALYSYGFNQAWVNHLGLTVWGQETAIQFGDWILITFSLVRLLAVVRPFGFRWLQTAKAARIITCCLLCVAGIFTLNNCVKNYYGLTHGMYDAAYKNNPKYKEPRWLEIWTDMQDQAETVMIFLKFCALLVINIFMVILIRRQQNSQLGKMRAGQQSNSNRRYRNSNILLLASVAVYLITQLPNLIYKSIIISAEVYNATVLTAAQRNAVGPFTSMAMMSNYALHFFLYVVCSERFRSQFLDIFGKMWCCKPLLARHVTARANKSRKLKGKESTEPEEITLESIGKNGKIGSAANSTKSKQLPAKNAAVNKNSKASIAKSAAILPAKKPGPVATKSAAPAAKKTTPVLLVDGTKPTDGAVMGNGTLKTEPATLSNGIIKATPDHDLKRGTSATELLTPLVSNEILGTVHDPTSDSLVTEAVTPVSNGILKDNYDSSPTKTELVETNPNHPVPSVPSLINLEQPTGEHLLTGSETNGPPVNVSNLMASGSPGLDSPMSPQNAFGDTVSARDVAGDGHPPHSRVNINGLNHELTTSSDGAKTTGA